MSSGTKDRKVQPFDLAFCQRQPKFKVPKSLATDFVQSSIWSLAFLEAVCPLTNGGARC